VTLGRTVPALPVCDVAAAVGRDTERFGFAAVDQDAGFAVLVPVVLHPDVREPRDTDFGTREPAPLGGDGNLIEFHLWR
jgi:hypothetical protein